MSTAIVQPPLDFGTRIGRSYAASEQWKSQAFDRQMSRLGLIPDSERGSKIGVAHDAFTNAAARIGFGTNSVAEGAEYELVRWSYNYWLMITLYRNQWIPRKIVDIPAGDMIRAWPKLTSDIEPTDLTKIDRCIRETLTKSQLLETLRWARLFGGAAAVMSIDGHDNRLDEPLDIDTVELGAYKGLLPFDRWVGIYPDVEVCNDISRPLEFNLPEYYRVQVPGGGAGFRIHASRVLRFTGPSVPAPEYQAQMSWGISVLEISYEAMKMRDNMLWNMLGLTFRANLLAFKFDELAQMLSGANSTQAAMVNFYSRMQAMNDIISNQSMLVVPKDGGLESQQYAFAGCSDMMEQFRYEVSGAADIPEMRLFGHSPTGLGTKDDPAERLYEEKIALEQEDKLRPQLDKLYPVLCMSTLGFVPDDLDLRFPSIRIPSEQERSELSKSVSDGVVSVYNAGICKKKTALMELKQSSDATGIWTNISDEDIAEAEEDDKELKLVEEAQQQAQIESAENPEPEPTAPKLIAGGRGAAKDAAFRMIAGLPITVEYHGGTRRQIRNAKNELVYDRLLQYDYGEIAGTIGRDGDAIDCILGPAENSRYVYICDMEDLGPDLDIRQDEDKVCLFFQSESAAIRAFNSMYPPSWLVSVEEVPLADFIEQLEESGFALDEFKESEHPRVSSGPNAGQFGNNGGGSTTSSKTSKPASVPQSYKIPKSEFPLNSKQRTVEQRFDKQIESDPNGMMQEYRARFGNVLNADNAKELSTDYLKDRSDNAVAVHEGASTLVKWMYADELAKPAPKGKENMVLFTAGGAGAGKTTAIEGSETARAAMGRAQIVYDGTLRPSSSAQKKVEEALTAGKQAVVLYVYRDPVEAFENGVLKRAILQEQEYGSGRTVPIGEFAAQHASVGKSMSGLNEKYKDNPNFHLGVLDNSHGAGGAKQANLEDLPKPLSEEELRGKLEKVLHAAYKDGRISRKIYEATIGGHAKGEVGM